MHWLLALPFSLALLLMVMLARALSGSKAPPAGSLDKELLKPFAGAEEKLAALLRVPTVSSFDQSEEDEEAFAQFKAELKAQYPLAHERLLLCEPSGRSLLFEWPGRRRELDPAILCAHYDVVPAGDVELWEHPPFSGAVLDGFVHGRGAQDIKIMLASAMSAAEFLLARGFVPERSIYFAFGGDEEVGGLRGAAAIAAELKQRGVRASFLLDEGGFVADGLLPFADRPLALIGISEKGYMDVALEAQGSGGHASMPPRHTAAGVVAKAVTATEARRFRAKITYTMAGLLKALSRYSPFAYRFLFRNLFLTAPLVKAAFSAAPSTNALLRTTSAATMLSGSQKENVLPQSARAVLNVRLLPGSTVAGVLRELDAIAASAGARAVLAHQGHANDPLPESSVDHEGYKAIVAALSRAFPEAGAVPFMFTAGTDTKHYTGLTEGIYRLAPIFQNPEDIARVHAANERISIENVRRAVLFYVRLMEGL
jgi:carboxypeptidase PM20D1